MASYEAVCSATESTSTLWAWSQLKQHTFGRVEADTVDAADVKPCFDALVELYESIEGNHGQTVASESVGSWSRSYDASTAKTAARVRSIINQWLGNIPGLLYRGLD